MKHLGDITQMSGYEIPPVDVITFGSPCQDLSIAGKRAGMAGERSGLFSEAVRIIREMRMATWGMYPKYAVWENVPGAYSSNKGEDFHAVIESLCQIIDPGVSVPRPKSKQRGGLLWPHAGAIVGNGYSLAWRTMDAQHWGVPQRRKRIALVLDLTGECAGEVLFEPESLRGHFAPCITARQTAPGNAETGIAGTDSAHPGLIAFSFDSLASNSMKSSNPYSGCREVDLARTIDTSTPDPSKNQGGIAIAEPKAYTLKIRSGCEGGGKGALVQVEKSATLSTLQDQTVFCIAGNVIDRSDTAGANGTGVKEDVSYTLNTVDRPAVVYDARSNGDGKVVPTMTGDHNGHISDYSTVIVERVIKWIVRRLTPTECERLQGYPDNWTALGEWIDSKGKLHKDADSPRYKALGNSIALPQWYYVLGGISDRLTENATLGSLFDGIGGFPKVWADLHNGNKKLCVWASEIEEFPIAVTRKHFPEE